MKHNNFTKAYPYRLEYLGRVLPWRPLDSGWRCLRSFKERAEALEALEVMRLQSPSLKWRVMRD